MLETKRQYVDRVSLVMTREMKPALDSLAEPCTCAWTECTGWKLRTMVKAELPPEVRSKGATRWEEK